MGSKDPFNFDDIYKEAGVDNLFVKKSMAEQKAMAKPAPATPPRPQPQQHSPVLATSPGGFSQVQRPAGSTPPVRTPMGGSKPSSASNLAGLDDPFADLSGISKPAPMAAQKTPVRAATPPRPAQVQQPPAQPVQQVQPPVVPAAPPSPAAAPAAPAAHAFDLEDMFGSTSSSSRSNKQQHAAPAPAPAAAVTAAAAHHDDPFAAFGGVEGASAAVPAEQAPPPAGAAAAAAREGAARQQAAVPPAAVRHEAAQRYSRSSQDGAGARSSSSSQREQAGVRDSHGYQQQHEVRQPAQHRHHQPQQQQPQQQQPSSPDTARQPEHYHSSRQEAPGSFSSLAAERAYGVDAVDGGYDRGREMYGAGGDSFSGAASGGKGWGGLLKSVTKTAATLGKKGLKAAQAGLQQLETAIDNLDKQPVGRAHSSSDGRVSPGSDPRAQHGPHPQQQQQQQQPGAAAYDDVPAERVLSMAIHISELPSSRQEDALARLPRPVRQKVLALLREQAVIEGEEQLSSSNGGAPPPAAAAASRPGEAGFIPTHEFKLDEAGERYRFAPLAGRPAAAAPAATTAAAAAAAATITQPPPAAAPAVEEEDLLGLHGPPAAAAAAGPPPPARPVDRLSSVSGIDDFFSGGASSTAAAGAAATTRPGSKGSSGAAAGAAAARPRTAGSAAAAPAASAGMGSRMSGSEGHLADLLGGSGGAAAAASNRPGAPRAAAAGGDLMGGLEVLHLDVDVAAHGGLYAEGDGGDDGQEPAIRRQLRAARAAEKHAKMKAALAEQQAKEAEETARREQQQHHKQAHRDRIEAWRNTNKGNVRGLLGSLQTVLWEDSGWQPINMGDLLEPAQVRKAWMKANLLVHPDKVRQRNGGDEQVAIADMIFDALKEAWGQFRG